MVEWPISIRGFNHYSLLALKLRAIYQNNKFMVQFSSATTVATTHFILYDSLGYLGFTTTTTTTGSGW